MRRFSATPLLVMLCVGCLAATDVDDLLLLTITTDRTALAPGDTAHLQVSLSNHSDQPVTVPTPSCGPFFFILDSLGRTFAPPQNPCSGPLPAITIESRDSVTFVDPWAGDARTSTGETGRLAPGTYSVFATMYGTHTRVQSRAIAITVLAP